MIAKNILTIQQQTSCPNYSFKLDFVNEL